MKVAIHVTWNAQNVTKHNKTSNMHPAQASWHFPVYMEVGGGGGVTQCAPSSGLYQHSVSLSSFRHQISHDRHVMLLMIEM
jgi:hypothetical protein